MKTAVFLYSIVLRVYPRSYRVAFGADMLQTFIDSYGDMEAPGKLAHLRFWLFMLGDELGNIVQQHGVAFVQRYPFYRVSLPRLLVAGLCFIPAFIVCYAVLISITLWLPLPAVSGLGFPLALLALTMLSAIASGFGSYTLACTLARAVPAHHVR